MSAARAPTYPHKDNPSTLIYWDDLHAEPGLKMVSLAARGLWTYHMLAIMAGAGGYLAVEGRAITGKQLAALVGRPIAEVTAALNELRENHVYSTDRHGTPYNRRMVKAQKKAESNRNNGQKGGRPKILGGKEKLEQETQIKPNGNPNHNPNDLPRARGFQDSLASNKNSGSIEPDVPSDPAKIFFDTGIALLQELNPSLTEPKVRSLLGRVRQKIPDLDEAQGLLDDMAVVRPTDPASWLMGAAASALPPLRRLGEDDTIDPEFYLVAMEQRSLDPNADWESFRNLYVSQGKGFRSMIAAARRWYEMETKFRNNRLRLVK